MFLNSIKYPTDLSTEYFTSEGCYIIEIMNTPADENLSIARARVQSGVTTKVHWLDGITERYYILSGKGMVFLDDMDGFEVVEGDTIVIRPRQHQSIKNIGLEDLVFLCICTPRFKLDKYTEVK